MIRRVMCWGVTAAVLSTTACSASNPVGSQTQGSGSGQTLTVDIPADVETLDPAVTMDNASWKFSYPAYERLIAFKGASTELAPSLATRWKASDGGKVWTFDLAQGHTFVDGTPVDANAVKFSFDRVLKINKAPAGNFTEIASVAAPSSTQVTFTLNNPSVAFLSKLAANYGSIVNPKVMSHQQGDDMGQAYLADHTMGSGPYRLASHTKGQSLVLEANPAYKGQKPSITKAIFQIVSDPSAERLQLEKGDVDIAEGITTDQIAALSTDGTTVVKDASLLVDYIYMNTGKGNPALKQTAVRQAISYAIDYNGIIKSSQQGNAVQMRGPIPKGFTSYDDSLTQYTYDPAKAKQLLSSAGTVGPLTLLYSDHKAWWPSEALAIQADLQKVGIQVKLSKVDYATERALLDKGQFDLALGVWSPDYADPYMFMNLWFDSSFGGLAGNRAFYSNPQVDGLVRKAAVTIDETERMRLYNDAQKIVVQDPPYVYLYQTDFVLPMRSSVHGFVFNPMLEGIYNLADMNKA